MQIRGCCAPNSFVPLSESQISCASCVHLSGSPTFSFYLFKVDKEGTKSCKKSTFFPLIKASCRGEEDLFVTWLLTFSHIPYSSFTSQGRDHNGMSCISCSINFEDYFQSDWTPKKCFRIS